MAPPKAGNRHRARRREVVALGVRRDARRRACSGKQAHSQQENALDSLSPSSPGPRRRRPGPQHRRARALPRAGGGMPSAYLPEPGRPRGRQAVRRRRQDRRARRWSSRRPRSASRRCCRSPSPTRDRRGEGARGAKGLPDPRGTRSKNRLRSIDVPRVRIAGRPVRRLELRLMAALGEPWSVADAGPRAAALARGDGAARDCARRVRGVVCQAGRGRDRRRDRAVGS